MAPTAGATAATVGLSSTSASSNRPRRWAMTELRRLSACEYSPPVTAAPRWKCDRPYSDSRPRVAGLVYSCCPIDAYRSASSMV